MENNKTLKDEIIEAMDSRFDAFETRIDKKMDTRLGEFEGKINNRFDQFKREISLEIDEKTRYQGILLERIEEKVDFFGERLEMLDAKVDRHHEEFREFRGEVNFKLDVQHEALDKRVSALELKNS